MSLIWLMLLFGWNPKGLIENLKFEEVPEDHEHYLQRPIDAAFDAQGRLYLLDIQTRAVFRWNADGTFADSFGKAGNGPGEFGFQTRQGPQAHLSISGDDLYVCDGGKWAVQVFDLDGNYKTMIRFQQPNGQLTGFWSTANGTWLTQSHHFLNKDPGFEISSMDAKGNFEQLLYYSEKDIGRPAIAPTKNAITIEAYYPELTANYDRKTNKLVYAATGHSLLKVRDLASGKTHSIKLALPQVEVETQHQAEFEKQSWLKYNPNFKVVYPEKMPYFDRILQLRNGSFMVYHQSPVEQHIHGYVVDASGLRKSRFAFTAGQSGGLFGDSGRIVAVIVDDNGDFSIAEVAPKDVPPTSH